MVTLQLHPHKQPTVLEAIAVWCACLLVGAVGSTYYPDLWSPLGVGFSMTLMALLLIATLATLVRHYDLPHVGWANTITLVRATGVCWLAGVGIGHEEPLSADAAWTVAIAALILLLVDGLDGWIARKTAYCSRFGARFDMEVDAALSLVLAYLAWQNGMFGAWVLLLGLFRPAFVLAGKIWPSLTSPLPESFARKTVCVIQIASLITLQLPFTQGEIGQWIAGFALALITWSFGRDTLYLMNQARGKRS